MPIFIIDVFSSSAPRPTNIQVMLRFKMFLQNRLKADSDTAKTCTRFISNLKEVDDQLHADAPVRKDKD